MVEYDIYVVSVVLGKLKLKRVAAVGSQRIFVVFRIIGIGCVCAAVAIGCRVVFGEHSVSVSVKEKPYVVAYYVRAGAVGIVYAGNVFLSLYYAARHLKGYYVGISLLVEGKEGYKIPFLCKFARISYAFFVGVGSL